MTWTKALGVIAAGTLAVMLGLQGAGASVVVNISDNGTDTEAEVFGRLTTSTLVGAVVASGRQHGGLSSFGADPEQFITEFGSGPVNMDGYLASTGFLPVYGGGALSSREADASSGTKFAIWGSNSLKSAPLIFIGQGYQSGAVIRSTSTWNSLTIAASGFTEGRYVFGLSNGESVTLNIGADYVQPVPLPPSLAMLAGGLGVLVVWRRKAQR